MTQLSTLRHPKQIGVALLALLITAAGIAFVQPLVGLSVALLAVVVAVVPVLWSMASGRPRAKVRLVASVRPLPATQRSVWTADGTHRHALVVPIKRTDEYRLVLTVDGYALINDDGVIVYRLKGS